MTTARVRQYACEEASRFGISAGEVLGRSLKTIPSMARASVMRRLRADGFTTYQIGRWLDRSPAAISRASRKLERLHEA